MANTIQLYLLENRRVKVTKNGLPLAEDNSYRIIAGEEEATTFKIMSKPVDYELAEYTVEMVNSKGYGIMETAIVGDEFTLPISMATAGYGKIGIRAYLNDEVVTFEPIMVKVWNFIPTWKEQADIGAKVKKLIVEDLETDTLLVDGKEVQEKLTEDNKLPSELVSGLDEALEDLADDIEKYYAKKDGYYYEFGFSKESGVSDVTKAIAPYSKTSGVLQTQPFILQGTGCGNGESQVDTGTFCQIKAKRSNVVVPNQLFSSLPATDTINGITLTNNGDGSITLNGTSTARADFYGTNGIDIISGHKYLISKVANLVVHDDAWYLTTTIANVGKYEVATAVNTRNGKTRLGFSVLNAGVTFNNETFIPICSNLTMWYCGNDNIPSHLLSHPEDFFRYYQGSMDYTPNPTFQSSNGRWLRSWGRNVFDKTTIVVGKVIGLNGETSGGYWGNHSDYIKIPPNSSVYLKDVMDSSTYYSYAEYDASKQFLRVGVITPAQSTSGVITTSSDCWYIIVNLKPAQIDLCTVSIYYTGESGYNEHYPFELLAEIDTGNESLGAFDVKYPSGVIERNGDEYTFTGNETWGLSGSSFFYTQLASVSFAGDTSAVKLTNGIVAKQFPNGILRVYLSDNSSLTTSSDISALFVSGVKMQYKIANPTTEQGTPFPENMPINDFGTMGSDTTAIPQVYDIFYPVDYVRSLDTLINYTSGDMTALMLKSDYKVPSVPASNGTYVLKATYTNGTITYTWVIE